jgi:hypothetical protein
MSPYTVVEALDILKDGLSGLASGLEASTFDAFAIQRPEKRFGDRIIVAVPRATHAHGNAGRSQHGSIRITGVLRSTIRMKQHSSWWMSAEKSHTESRLNQRFVLDRRHCPSYHASGKEVKHDGKARAIPHTSTRQ